VFEYKYGDPTINQFEYNINGWWPLFSDPPLMGLILTVFFLIWNSIMSVMMIGAVLAPMTRGECG